MDAGQRPGIRRTEHFDDRVVPAKASGPGQDSARPLDPSIQIEMHPAPIIGGRQVMIHPPGRRDGSGGDLLPVDDQAQHSVPRTEVEDQLPQCSGAAAPLGAEEAHPVSFLRLDARRQRKFVAEMRGARHLQPVRARSCRRKQQRRRPSGARLRILDGGEGAMPAPRLDPIRRRSVVESVSVRRVERIEDLQRRRRVDDLNRIVGLEREERSAREEKSKPPGFRGGAISSRPVARVPG